MGLQEPNLDIADLGLVMAAMFGALEARFEALGAMFEALRDKNDALGVRLEL